MEETLNQVKKIINSRLILHFNLLNSDIKYNKFYSSTNENINFYMSLLDYNQKENALTVLSSGDHAFNLIYNGIKNVDTFDINSITEYYALGLKLAAIRKYDYVNFGIFMNKISKGYYGETIVSLDELTQILYDLLPFMELKYKKFWNEIIDYNYQKQKNNSNVINLFDMISCNQSDYKQYKLVNNYLLCEQNYNKFKIELSDSNINFTNCNVTDIPNKLNTKYDFIFLSNIADYLYKNFGKRWKYNKLKEVSFSLEQMLKDDGILGLLYIFYYNIRKPNKPLISNSSIFIKDFIDEKIFEIPYIFDDVDLSVTDAIVLKKKQI